MLTGATAQQARPANKLSAYEGFTKLYVLIKGFDIAIMHLYNIFIFYIVSVHSFFL